MPYTGSGILASRLAMDKVASRRIFALNGLSVPKYTVVEKISRGKIEEVCSGFYLPLVVKPASQGSSIGLSIIESQQELKRASDQAFKFDERVIIEEYIEGRELTVGVLDGMALPVIEIVPKNKFFDYQAKYTKGMTEYIVPARLSAKITRQVQQAALSAHRLLDCYGCSRVDAILGKDGKLYILEVNTIPGFTTTSLLPKAAKHCGIDFAQLCLRLLKTAYEKDQKKNPG
jgi:D-alanine-D-alanine ligase